MAASENLSQVPRCPGALKACRWERSRPHFRSSCIWPVLVPYVKGRYAVAPAPSPFTPYTPVCRKHATRLHFSKTVAGLSGGKGAMCGCRGIFGTSRLQGLPPANARAG
ncbi:hypothetical protein K432DRAFT_26510 [Lepidopterella palustris CBS 459.81]|uniref:Uncharacterized protein n=1 Tax=Lepidopterella palustris CBS 459.81 TaxID=1314670 RepID=A0A8E2JKN4_9PEZI|nr:hypothetical protein K432DRAFT_26510 [Lepidopterella palustris CBS 459.81]